MSYTVMNAAAARFDGYEAPVHNVLERECLEASLRALLTGLAQWPPERWAQHANYPGLASHWQDIHRAMLHNLDAVARTLGDLADDRVPEDARTELGRQVREAARHSIDHLHGHHRLEDEQMFPQLLRARPGLERPLSLLEADHIVLNAALGPFEQALARFPDAQAPASAYDRLALSAAQVTRIAHRHIADEEQIVIPAVLGVA